MDLEFNIYGKVSSHPCELGLQRGVGVIEAITIFIEEQNCVLLQLEKARIQSLTNFSLFSLSKKNILVNPNNSRGYISIDIY